MINLEDHVPIASDIPAGGGATLDLYFVPAHGIIVEDKTTCDGTHLYAELPVSSALENLTDDQTISIAGAILSRCYRENGQRPMTDHNKHAFDRLVAEYHYDIHEMLEIREAIEDYYH